MVAAGQDGTILRSEDGVHWSLVHHDLPAGDFFAVTYGAGLYVVGGESNVILAASLDGLTWTNILQELVPEEKLGRVSSIDILGSFVLLPLGFAFTGWLIDHVPVAYVFIAAGTVAAIVSILPLLHPAIRKLD